MRCAAGAGLLVLVGCNQVFGIHKTEPYDGAVDVIEDVPIVKLTLQVGGQLKPDGTPDPAVLDVPISPAPKVRFATLDGPWKDGTYNPDGSVEVEHAFFEPGAAAWRFEYTLDGVAHEVQWKPEDKRGQIAIPRFGRQARMTPPEGSGYDVTPGGIDRLDSPRVFTLGRWTEGVADHTGTMLRYDFASAASLSGSVGAPVPAEGDRAIAVNFVTDGDGCRRAIGSATLSSAALVNNAHSTPDAVWDIQGKPVSSAAIASGGPDLTRFNAGFTKVTSGAPSGALQYGYAVSPQLPGLTGVPSSPKLPVSTLLPTPAMVTLLSCPFVLDTAISKTVNLPIPLFDDFSTMFHAQRYAARTVSGIELVSGMESATTGSTLSGLTAVFPAAIPRAVMLDIGGVSADLIAGPEGAAVTAGAAVLHITPETAAGTAADYYDVVLQRLDTVAGGLVTERVYTVIAPQVSIAAGTLKPNTDYVFEIHAYRGHPQAAIGDFRTVAYPYGAVQLFTKTFHTAA